MSHNVRGHIHLTHKESYDYFIWEACKKTEIQMSVPQGSWTTVSGELCWYRWCCNSHSTLGSIRGGLWMDLFLWESNLFPSYVPGQSLSLSHLLLSVGQTLSVLLQAGDPWLQSPCKRCCGCSKRCDTKCGSAALMWRNTEVLQLRKCSVKGKGCLTAGESGENILNIEYT